VDTQLLQHVGAELVAHRLRFSRAVEMLSRKAKKAYRGSLEQGKQYLDGAAAADYFEAMLHDLARRVYDCAERYRTAGALEARGPHGARYVTHRRSLDREIAACLAELRGEA
jgi:osmotically-inducible protein OsmY